jgi:hypothetical protein
MGVFNRRYADPLKYASRGSTLIASTAVDCIVITRRVTQNFAAKNYGEMRTVRKLYP